MTRSPSTTGYNTMRPKRKRAVTTLLLAPTVANRRQFSGRNPVADRPSARKRTTGTTFGGVSPPVAPSSRRKPAKLTTATLAADIKQARPSPRLRERAGLVDPSDPVLRGRRSCDRHQNGSTGITPRQAPSGWTGLITLALHWDENERLPLLLNTLVCVTVRMPGPTQEATDEFPVLFSGKPIMLQVALIS